MGKDEYILRKVFSLEKICFATVVDQLIDVK